MKKTALVAGVFYLITFISIPTQVLYGPVKNRRDWILRPAAWVRVERLGHPLGMIGGCRRAGSVGEQGCRLTMVE
jgi:hypothetical protein